MYHEQEYDSSTDLSLATIVKVTDIIPIADADNIELAKIKGWQCVVAKGDFKPGDLAVYIQIDAFIPKGDPIFNFLERTLKNHEGLGEGYRVRSMRLKGQLSQGILLDKPVFNEAYEIDWTEGSSVVPNLGIKKYTKPIPANLAGSVKGNFPSFIRKTDQERAQNLTRELFGHPFHGDSVWFGQLFEKTVKLDGSSITIYHNNGQVGVCSRNQELKMDDLSSAFVSTAINQGLVDVLVASGLNIALQGELIGPGIQKNKENLSAPKIFIFDIYDIDRQKYWGVHQRRDFCQLYGVAHVPTLGIFEFVHRHIDPLLEESKTRSLHADLAEGIVFKSLDGEFSFKVINNDWLLKYEK